MQPEDLPALQRLYHAGAQGIVGAAVRAPDNVVWTTLLREVCEKQEDECRVLEHPDGHVAAYAWRGKPFWYVRLCERYGPDSLTIAEVMAEDSAAADAVLAACRAWGEEETRRRGRPIDDVTLLVPPEGYIGAAAMMQDAKVVTNCFSDGGLMGQVLDTPRTLQALQPELEARLPRANSPFTGNVRIETDRGSVVLSLRPGELTVVSGKAMDHVQVDETLDLPQTTLTRLVLGAFAPHDLLMRLLQSLSPQMKLLLATLFPLRTVHLYAPDRGTE